MLAISKLATEMKCGSKCVTLTKPLISDQYSIIDTKRYAMSWGPATCFIQIRN